MRHKRGCKVRCSQDWTLKLFKCRSFLSCFVYASPVEVRLSTPRLLTTTAHWIPPANSVWQGDVFRIHFFFFLFFLLELEMLRQTKSCRFWRKKAGHSSCDIWNKLVKLKSHQKNSTERFSSLKLQRTHFCSVWLFIKKYEPSKWHTVNKRDAFSAWSLALQRVPQKRVWILFVSIYVWVLDVLS